jgi:2-polyprenyl-3-methyl-5-hydroxy-6-metoxy-1,4-benzoquinol methylase
MKQNIYDDPEFFAGYSALRKNESGLNAVLEQPALRSVLPPLVGKRILDLGCGFGDFCRFARSEGAQEVLGVDISEKMLQVAVEKTHDPFIVYQKSAVEDAVLGIESFDLVVSSYTLHYVENLRPVADKVYDALAPGGCFVFSVEHPIVTSLSQGWCKTPGDEKKHWPVDNYQSEGLRLSRWFVDGVAKYHRTVESYIGTFLAAGFVLKNYLEPQPSPQQILERPDLKDELRRPPILVIRVDKPA